MKRLLVLFLLVALNVSAAPSMVIEYIGSQAQRLNVCATDPLPVNSTFVMSPLVAGSGTIGSLGAIVNPLPAGTNTLGSVTSNLGTGTNTVGSVGAIVNALPAGTNLLGSITVSAGANSIGSVSLLAGVNEIGSVGILVGSNTIGSVGAIINALPAGTNLLGSVTLSTGNNTVGSIGAIVEDLPAGVNELGSVTAIAAVYNEGSTTTYLPLEDGATVQVVMQATTRFVELKATGTFEVYHGSTDYSLTASGVGDYFSAFPCGPSAVVRVGQTATPTTIQCNQRAR